MTNRRRRIYALTAAVSLALGVAGCAAYRKCGFQGCPGDSKIAAGVDAAFTKHAELQPPNLIDVQVIGGVVYLYGLVDTDYQLQMAEIVAHQVPGVVKVVNSIGLAGNAR
ncbi:MAG: BON domain-containing protein [Steroidobacteraceae bacterium]